MTILFMPAPADAQSNPYDIYSSTPGSCAAIVDCSDLTETYFTTVKNPPGTYTNCEDAGSSGPHLGTGNTWYIDGKVSDGSIHGRGFEYYTTGTLPPECDDGPGLPPDCPIPPEPGFVVEDPTGGSCPTDPVNPFDMTNPCNLANGNKLQVEQDYRGPGDGSLSFSRFYNSIGEYNSADNFGIGWRHSYSRFMDERPDKEPLPHAAIQSSVYTSGQSACETGWGDINTAALGGDLSTGVAVYAGGNSCEISVGGSVKAILSYSDTNRLSGVLDNVVTVATYEHNALGQRTKKVVGSTTTIFIFDLFGNLIAEHDATGTLIKDHVWANGVPVAQIDTGEVFSYLHTNHRRTAFISGSKQSNLTPIR